MENAAELKEKVAELDRQRDALMEYFKNSERRMEELSAQKRREMSAVLMKNLNPFIANAGDLMKSEDPDTTLERILTEVDVD